MNFLEERILKDGIVKPNNVLKVDSFLNHQMDISLMEEIGREFRRRFDGKELAVTTGLGFESEKKLLRLLQADFCDVFKRSHPRILLKNSAQMLTGDTADFCKIGKFYHAHIVIVNEL